MKIKFKLYLILSAWLCFNLTLVASSTADSLSLDYCIEQARLNNVRISNSQLAITAAKESRSAARTNYFPKISAGATGYYAVNPLIEFGIDDVENANLRDILYSLYAQYGQALGMGNSIDLFQRGVTVGLNAVQPIYAGGIIANSNRLTSVGVDVAQCNAKLVEESVINAIEENYWLIVSLSEKQKTINSISLLLDSVTRDAKVAADAGIINKNELLTIQLRSNELSSAQLKLTNGEQLAKMALCQLIGIEYSDSIVLVDTLSDAVAPELLYLDKVEATDNRTELKLLDLGLKASRIERNIIIGESLPKIAVGANYSYGSMVFDRFSHNALFFATLSMPLLNWWATSHKLKRHNVNYQILQNSRTDLYEKMQLQVQQAWNQLNESYMQIDIAQSAVNDANANMNYCLQHYRAALIPITQLLEAQSLLQKANDQLLEQRILYQIKSLYYKRITSSRE